MRVAIVDDEPLARAKLRRLLGALPDVVCVGEAGSGSEAIALIRDTTPDVVFLDIDLADMDGFGVVAALAGGPLPLIIFATAYDAFALRAFEVHALDYLLKPFDAGRLEAAVAHARRSLGERGATRPESLTAVLEEIRAQRELLERGARAEAPGRARRLMVRRGSDLVPVAVADIDWIGAADNYVELHVAGDTHLLRETLQSVEDRLDPAEFSRIHRRTIINQARVRAIRQQPLGDVEVVLRDGTALPVGRSYRASVCARWQGGGARKE